MGVYLILLGISLIILLGQIFNSSNNTISTSSSRFSNYFGSVLLGAALFFLYIFRGSEVGTDYSMYSSFFFRPIDSFQQSGLERGYVEIIRISQTLNQPLIFSLVSFVLCYFGIFLFARRYSLPIITTLAILPIVFFYFDSYNIIRQMSSVGIVLVGLSVSNILETHTKITKTLMGCCVYVFFIWLASLFHMSAFIALIIPFLNRIDISSFKVVSIWFLSTIGYFIKLGNKVIPPIVHLFPHFEVKYYQSTMFFMESDKGFFEYLPILIQFIFLFLIVTYDIEFIKDNKTISSYYLIYLFWFIAGGTPAALRGQVYWLPSIVLFYGLYIVNGQKNIGLFDTKIFKSIILLFWLIYTILRLLKGIDGVVPYSFTSMN